jgi:hypothetical protein
VAAEPQWTVRLARMAVGLLISALVAGCGDDDSDSSAEIGRRDAGERALPGRSAPDEWTPDASIDSGLRDDFFASYDAGPCCAIDFALRARPGEVYAILRGSDAPLDGPEGVPLSYETGGWKATVCMPPNYGGVYYYVVYSTPDTGDDAGVAPAPQPASEPIPFAVLEDANLFRETRHNEAALTDTDPVLGVVNLFPPSDACGGTDSARHSTIGDTSSMDPDAGL